MSFAEHGNSVKDAVVVVVYCGVILTAFAWLCAESMRGILPVCVAREVR